MDASKTSAFKFGSSIFAFLMYWIFNPAMGFYFGPDYLFGRLWFIIAQIIFMPLTLGVILGEIRKIAEPGEVRWFGKEVPATPLTTPPNLREVKCCMGCTRWHPNRTPTCPRYNTETRPSQVCDDHDPCPES